MVDFKKALDNKRNRKSNFVVIVAGSRDFNDYEFLKEKMLYLLKNKINKYEITIRSGHANGADKLGEKLADEFNFQKDIMPAKWNRKPDGSFNKRAGLERNLAMARKGADACVIFFKDLSAGSLMMMDICKRENIPYRSYLEKHLYERNE